jgi:hypothetical protein
MLDRCKQDRGVVAHKHGLVMRSYGKKWVQPLCSFAAWLLCFLCNIYATAVKKRACLTGTFAAAVYVGNNFFFVRHIN